MIGSALDAELDLYCSEGLLERLGKLEDELRFVLITSYARLHSLSETDSSLEKIEMGNGEALAIKAVNSAHGKCVRCWHHREDVGSNAEHPELCGRCVDNVIGEGEQRRFA